MTHMPRTGVRQHWQLTWQYPVTERTRARVMATLADEDIIPTASDAEGMRLHVEYALARRAVHLIRLVSNQTVVMTEVWE